MYFIKNSNSRGSTLLNVIVGGALSLIFIQGLITVYTSMNKRQHEVERKAEAATLNKELMASIVKMFKSRVKSPPPVGGNAAFQYSFTLRQPLTQVGVSEGCYAISIRRRNITVGPPALFEVVRFTNICNFSATLAAEEFDIMSNQGRCLPATPKPSVRFEIWRDERDHANNDPATSVLDYPSTTSQSSFASQVCFWPSPNFINIRDLFVEVSTGYEASGNIKVISSRNSFSLEQVLSSVNVGGGTDWEITEAGIKEFY